MDLASIFVPGGTKPGTLFVRCKTFPQGQPPLLRSIGKIPFQAVPETCAIDMDWDVFYEGRHPLTGREALLSLTQSAMSSRENPDPHTAYSRARDTAQVSPLAGWHRYSHRMTIKNHPHMEFMLIVFELAHPGTYAFRPPVLTIVHADGTRRPFLSNPSCKESLTCAFP